MKIIKKGKLPKEEKRMTCSYCGCVFEYNRSDVHTDQREGDWVECPTCGRCLDVD